MLWQGALGELLSRRFSIGGEQELRVRRPTDMMENVSARRRVESNLFRFIGLVSELGSHYLTV
jgi:hypothetical protein